MADKLKWEVGLLRKAPASQGGRTRLRRGYGAARENEAKADKLRRETEIGERRTEDGRTEGGEPGARSGKNQKLDTDV